MAAPAELDVAIYDPNTGFGLFGTPAFGTRFGQSGPLARIENVRPLCMDFFKQGFCNRRGPHNQVPLHHPYISHLHDTVHSHT